jgi:hypothetical protein
VRVKFLIIGGLALSCLTGCFFLPQSLKTLKSVGDSQDEIAAYLDRQVELFNRLLSDFKAEALKPGISRAAFIKTYGEPILIEEVSEPLQGVKLLYRHPTEYFKSDRLYLYFDRQERLVFWEYKPYRIPRDTSR